MREKQGDRAGRGTGRVGGRECARVCTRVHACVRVCARMRVRMGSGQRGALTHLAIFKAVVGEEVVQAEMAGVIRPSG